MAVLEDLDDDECALLAILDDESGLDLAEFCWRDDNNEDGCWRAWPYQWCWFRCTDRLQIDHAARSLGKSVSIQLRGFVFAFVHPGMEMLITAPELIHLQPVTSAIENRIMSVRLAREMLDKKNRGTGFTHQPFGVQFANGARIMGRIPQRDGKGVKGSLGKDSLIFTDVGLKPIQEILIGDKVLTHRGHYRDVIGLHSYEADTVSVSGAGHRGLTVSTNHRFYGRRNSNPQRKKNLSPPSWIIADSLELDRNYWASPFIFPYTELPEVPSAVVDLQAFMWTVGRWVADGAAWGVQKSGKRGTAAICVNDKKLSQVLFMLESAGYKAKARPGDNANFAYTCSTELCSFLFEHFGHRAEGKRIPTWLYSANRMVRENFLAGYLSGDGHWCEQKGRWEIGTASKELAVGLKLLAQTLGYTCSFSWVDPKVNSISGVELKSRPQRSWRVQMKQNGRGLFENTHVWQKIRQVEPAGIQKVYDLVVEGDCSYVADGLVHRGGLP